MGHSLGDNAPGGPDHPGAGLTVTRKCGIVAAMIKFFKSLFGPIPDQIKLLDKEYSDEIETIKGLLGDHGTIIYLGYHQFSTVTRMQLLGTDWPEKGNGADGRYSLMFMGRTVIPVDRRSYIGQTAP